MENRFDTEAATWDENLVHRERNRAIAAAILETIQPKGSEDAMEYGAGTGLLSRELAPHLGSIVLADSSAGMVEEAKRIIAASGLRNLSAMRLDLEKDEPPAGGYRILYSAMALHHVNDVDGVLARFAEMVKPNGWLAIADLEPEDGSFHGQSADVHKGFDPEALGARLAANGFTGITHRRVYSVKREGGDFPVFLITARRHYSCM